MINLDDVEYGLRELERAARLGPFGAMITEYLLTTATTQPATCRAALLPISVSNPSVEAIVNRLENSHRVGGTALAAQETGKAERDPQLTEQGALLSGHLALVKAVFCRSGPIPGLLEQHLVLDDQRGSKDDLDGRRTAPYALTRETLRRAAGANRQVRTWRPAPASQAVYSSSSRDHFRPGQGRDATNG